MAENTTVTQWTNAVGLNISSTVSFLSIAVSTFVCLIIIVLICITPNLRSPANLLVSNTCLSTLFYSIVSMINTFYFFMEIISTDWSCRIRGYFSYVSLNLVMYSYLIQAISRLFYTVLYGHRFLLTIKCHLYLIISQICLSFLLSLPSLITEDIVFRPLKLCLVSMKYKIHLFYTLAIGYIIPLTTIIFLYTIIYRRIIRSTSNVRETSRRTKRDSALARNILILLSIFIFGGIPVVVYVIVSSQIASVPTILFLLAVTAPSVTVAIEKVMTIVLNKDIRKALKQRWVAWFPCCLSSATRVQPFPGVNQTIRGTIQMTTVKKTERKQSNLPNI